MVPLSASGMTGERRCRDQVLGRVRGRRGRRDHREDRRVAGLVERRRRDVLDARSSCRSGSPASPAAGRSPASSGTPPAGGLLLLLGRRLRGDLLLGLRPAPRRAARPGPRAATVACSTACCSCCCCCCCELVELLLVVVGRAAAEVDGDQERPVDAGPEALAQQVVGLPGLWWTWASCALSCWPSWRLSTGIASTSRIATPSSMAGSGRLPTPRAHLRPAVRAVIVGWRLQERDPQGVDPLAEDGQKRRQQGHRRDHRDQDDDRRGVAERADDRDLRDRQGAEGDHHGAPGEDDGPAGGARPRGPRPRSTGWPCSMKPRWRVTMNSA